MSVGISGTRPALQIYGYRKLHELHQLLKFMHIMLFSYLNEFFITLHSYYKWIIFIALSSVCNYLFLDFCDLQQSMCCFSNILSFPKKILRIFLSFLLCSSNKTLLIKFFSSDINLILLLRFAHENTHLMATTFRLWDWTSVQPPPRSCCWRPLTTTASIGRLPTEWFSLQYRYLIPLRREYLYIYYLLLFFTLD